MSAAQAAFVIIIVIVFVFIICLFFIFFLVPFVTKDHNCVFSASGVERYTFYRNFQFIHN